MNAVDQILGDIRRPLPFCADLASARSEVLYIPIGNEVEAIEAAYRQKLAIMLTGPTGCGKTRLVEHVAQRLNLPIYTVSCHEDVTASDLLGRYVLRGNETCWVDGPLTRAVKDGGICYLDEVVEARQDATVAIHSLTDHRRELFIERLGGLRLAAADSFCLVVSYNPGYQSILKDLKQSTRQRMIAIGLDYPSMEVEIRIIVAESGASADVAERFARLGQAMRNLDSATLREVPSTRVLIAAAKLTVEGLPARQAAELAIVSPITDDPRMHDELNAMVEAYV